MASLVESQITPNEDEQAFLFAMQVVRASILPMVMKSVIELDLLEILARAGEGEFLTPDRIAAQMPSRNPEAAVMLDRILRFLTSCSVLMCRVRELTDGGEERLYAVGPMCKYLTRNEDGGSIAAMVLLSQDKVIKEPWNYLKDAVLEGIIPANKAYGMSFFEYLGTDQKFNKIFNEGMSNHSTIVMKKILETYAGFEGLGSLVDVGGGTGAALSMILSKYPSIKCINFDLPHVIEDAPAFPGVQHVSGDMFASVPHGDAIFMKWIIHNWSDTHCLNFLKNCYDALPKNGKMIVLEGILPVYPDTSVKAKNVFSLDVVMLIDFPGGKERTEKEFESLAKKAGFTGFRVVCSIYTNTLMEFIKNA